MNNKENQNSTSSKHQYHPKHQVSQIYPIDTSAPFSGKDSYNTLKTKNYLSQTLKHKDNDVGIKQTTSISLIAALNEISPIRIEPIKSLELKKATSVSNTQILFPLRKQMSTQMQSAFRGPLEVKQNPIVNSKSCQSARSLQDGLLDNSGEDLDQDEQQDNESASQISEDENQSGANASQHTQQYSRKEKSLGELCRRFLHSYGIEGKGVLLLDSCTKELGVERRRIYDIINILESFCVIRRRAKNEYQWRGIDKIACSIEAQIEQGNMIKNKQDFNLLLNTDSNIGQASFQKAYQKVQSPDLCSIQNSNCENPTFFNLNQRSDLNYQSKLTKHKLVEVPSDEEDRIMCQQGKRQPKYKKVKSLGNFCQQFIHLFVGWKQVISLEEAARQITDDEQINEKALKTKIRRLYDIANVLQSIGLIEKTHMSTNRKPAFRWVGITGVYAALAEIKQIVKAQKPENSTALFTLVQPPKMKKVKSQLSPAKLAVKSSFYEPNNKRFKRAISFMDEQSFSCIGDMTKPSTAFTSTQISPQVMITPKINIGLVLQKRPSSFVNENDVLVKGQEAKVFTQQPAQRSSAFEPSDSKKRFMKALDKTSISSVIQKTMGTCVTSLQEETTSKSLVQLLHSKSFDQSNTTGAQTLMMRKSASSAATCFQSLEKIKQLSRLLEQVCDQRQPSTTESRINNVIQTSAQHVVQQQAVKVVNPPIVKPNFLR